MKTGAFSRALFFFDRIQDLEVLGPSAHVAFQRAKERVEILLTRDLVRQFPRAAGFFQKKSMPFAVTDSARFFLGFTPRWEGVGVLITASESTARPHRLGHVLTKRANRRGVVTLTLQHGYENIGLTYFDKSYPPESVRFASKHVLIWGPRENLHPSALEETRRKCVSVGAVCQGRE